MSFISYQWVYRKNYKNLVRKLYEKKINDSIIIIKLKLDVGDMMNKNNKYRQSLIHWKLILIFSANKRNGKKN